MAALNTISLVYSGGDADENRLDLYDASISYEGFARTLAVIGHYYLNQRVIVRAPYSDMPLYLTAPESGSLKQNIIAGVVGGLIVTGVGVPFTIFATRLIDSWIPAAPTDGERQIIELLKEQNALLRRSARLPSEPNEEESKQVRAAERFIEEKSKDLQVVRSVTSQSFKKIFRPIETQSANEMGMVGGRSELPTKFVDTEILARIKADEIDSETVIVTAVVNSFSRSSKTGLVFSRDYMASFRIEYGQAGRLPREDDFSWSQYSGKPIRMTGRFVRFFDGKVKKLLVNHVERVDRQNDIDDYFDSDRRVLSL